MKSMLKTFVFFLLVAGIVFCSHDAQADTKSFKASLAIMPQSAEIDENGNYYGAYVELIRALDKLTSSKTEMDVVPFKRSISNLTSGRADYHIPLIKIPGVPESELPYSFSTETLFQVSFVLYTNKSHPIDAEKLRDYSLITDSAHTDFFPFPIRGTACLPCAIKMVNAGRIDGFIFAQNEIDPIIRAQGLTNVHRQLYKNYDVKIVLPKGQRGKEVDAYFSEGIKILRERGEYDKLLAPVLLPYQEWQP